MEGLLFIGRRGGDVVLFRLNQTSYPKYYNTYIQINNIFKLINELHHNNIIKHIYIGKVKAHGLSHNNNLADKAAKETAEKVNGADSMIFQTEKQLKEFGEKLSADKKEPIEAALVELKAAHASKDLAQIDAAMEKINEAWKVASEEMYAAEQAAGGTDAGAEQQGQPEATDAQGDNVEDVDFEEVK